MRIRQPSTHGQIAYAKFHSCTCPPCTAVLVRYEARMDGIIDPITVERLMHRVPVWATHGEMVEAAAQLAARGNTITTIAVILGVSDRAVSRYMAEHRAAQRELVAA